MHISESFFVMRATATVQFFFLSCIRRKPAQSQSEGSAIGVEHVFVCIPNYVRNVLTYIKIWCFWAKFIKSDSDTIL